MCRKGEACSAALLLCCSAALLLCCSAALLLLLLCPAGVLGGRTQRGNTGGVSSAGRWQSSHPFAAIAPQTTGMRSCCRRCPTNSASGAGTADNGGPLQRSPTPRARGAQSPSMAATAAPSQASDPADGLPLAILRPATLWPAQ
ncbi:hypothetical protein BDZ91DRAFT_766169 [Kalaharituber pfeilii]|nr:hypothetical protein BDZ91DRAFT_766169 [Kalaharituber pfeilii]